MKLIALVSAHLALAKPVCVVKNGIAVLAAVSMIQRPPVCHHSISSTSANVTALAKHKTNAYVEQLQSMLHAHVQLTQLVMLTNSTTPKHAPVNAQ